MQAWAGWGVGLALGTRANGSGVREPRDSLKSPMCSRTGNRTVQYPIWTVTRRVTYSVHCGHPLCPENWGSEDRTEIITHMSVVTTHICGETYGLKLYYKLGRSPRTHSHTHTHTHTLRRGLHRRREPAGAPRAAANCQLDRSHSYVIPAPNPTQ